MHFLHNLSGQEVPLDRAMRLRTWNAVTLLELAQCDALVTPTAFQRQQFPEPFRDRFHLIHEGVNASFCELLEKRLPKNHHFETTLLFVLSRMLHEVLSCTEAFTSDRRLCNCGVR